MSCMYPYACVRKRALVYACVRARAHAFACVCAYVHLCMCMIVQARTLSSLRVCAGALVHLCVCGGEQAHVCVCMLCMITVPSSKMLTRLCSERSCHQHLERTCTTHALDTRRARDRRASGTPAHGTLSRASSTLCASPAIARSPVSVPPSHSSDGRRLGGIRGCPSAQ